MKIQTTVPIFYTCDESLVSSTIVSLKSIIENASSDYKYTVCILHTGISYNMMKKVFKLQNDSFNITFEDVSCYATASTPLSDWSKTDKLRDFISEMFPGYDRAICMDGNTVFDGDTSRGFVPVSLGGKGIPA